MLPLQWVRPSKLAAKRIDERDQRVERSSLADLGFGAFIDGLPARSIETAIQMDSQVRRGNMCLLKELSSALFLGLNRRKALNLSR